MTMKHLTTIQLDDREMLMVIAALLTCNPKGSLDNTFALADKFRMKALANVENDDIYKLSAIYTRIAVKNAKA